MLSGVRERERDGEKKHYLMATEDFCTFKQTQKESFTIIRFLRQQLFLRKYSAVLVVVFFLFFFSKYFNPAKIKNVRSRVMEHYKRAPLLCYVPLCRFVVC